MELPAPCNLLWDREEESGGGEYPAGREPRRAEAIHSSTHMSTFVDTYMKAVDVLPQEQRRERNAERPALERGSRTVLVCV